MRHFSSPRRRDSPNGTGWTSTTRCTCSGSSIYEQRTSHACGRNGSATQAMTKSSAYWKRPKAIAISTKRALIGSMHPRTGDAWHRGNRAVIWSSLTLSDPKEIQRRVLFSTTSTISYAQRWMPVNRQSRRRG